jgi:hypothetical protein
MRSQKRDAPVKVLLTLQVRFHIQRHREPDARIIATLASKLLQRREQLDDIVCDAGESMEEGLLGFSAAGAALLLLLLLLPLVGGRPKGGGPPKGMVVLEDMIV